jgi:tRNA-specific 2-thiouridylase
MGGARPGAAVAAGAAEASAGTAAGAAMAEATATSLTPPDIPSPQRALVAMSGGVDSSVAASLLHEEGYDCAGATMRLIDDALIGSEGEGGCCSLADVEDARAVCVRLGIPHYAFNFMEDFAAQVVERFVSAYEHGATPNPCIDCNRFLKFERLLERARQTGFDYVATGHYVRKERGEGSGRHLLKRGIDPGKDQSYVLYATTQEQLAHALFPLGGLTKEQVRARARASGLATAEKRESQDICFVPDGSYGAFIRRHTGRPYAPGPLVDEQGRQLGTHQGVIDFTVGQRKGIGVAAAHPLYVREIDPACNRVVVCPEQGLYARTAVVNDLNLIPFDALDGPLQVSAKHRYRQSDRPAVVRQLDDDTLRVDFDEPQKAMAKGQALVLYDGDYVIGGGTIADTME